DLHEAHPFVAQSLYDALCEAKDRALAQMRERGALRYMLPWLPADMDEIDDVFGGDPWPYRIEARRSRRWCNTWSSNTSFPSTFRSRICLSLDTEIDTGIDCAISSADRLADTADGMINRNL